MAQRVQLLKSYGPCKVGMIVSVPDRRAGFMIKHGIGEPVDDDGPRPERLARYYEARAAEAMKRAADATAEAERLANEAEKARAKAQALGGKKPAKKKAAKKKDPKPKAEENTD